jgi:hypothetical protein
VSLGILQHDSAGKYAAKVSRVKQLNLLKFQLCGVVILLSGFYLFTDQKKLLMSSLLVISQDESNPLKDLKHPLFVYVACALTILGLICGFSPSS